MITCFYTLKIKNLFSFSGEISNFVMWPRILTSTEIHGIVYDCEYPEDFVIRPQLTNIEWNGEAEVEILEECPHL